MLNAILNSKSGRLHADSGEKISWRKLFRENEDLVTATVIERFSYMNPVEVWRILSSAAKGQLPRYRVAEVTKIEFWPLWSHEERQKGVEPDVFIEFSLGDPARLIHVIVEAKHGAHQLHNQLMVEIESWYQSFTEADSHLPEQIYILALGGSSGHIDPAKFHRSVKAKMPLVPFSGLVSIGWDELAKAVSEARVDSGSIAPSQTIAVDQDYPAQHTPVIDTRLTVRLGKEGLKTRHLRVGQPEKIRHVHRSFFSRESCRPLEINGS